jgi:hypothetical protein
MLNTNAFKNKEKCLLLSLFLILTTFVISPVATADEIEWEVTLNFSEPGGANANVVFGEVTDANDGPPADNYDVPSCPSPPEPHIRAWFDDGLSYPYDVLWEDYREYFIFNTYKTWNLTIYWQASTATSITIEWDTNMVNKSEYNSMILYDDTGITPLEDMRKNNSYTFTIDSLNVDFKIIARVSGNNPPNTPDNPNPTNGSSSVSRNKILSWTGGDPDLGDTVAYDVYFGAAMPLTKVENGLLVTTFDPSTMSYKKTYYWRIVAWDNHGASVEGTLWSFTTEKQNTQPPYNPPYNPPPTNQDPIANASASETSEFINTPVIFDGSLSSDEDGSITNYTWSFGDETAGYGDVTTHAYVSPGEYIVTLTVTDNEGATDDDTITIVISKPNIPPNTPEVGGKTTGKQDIEYAYTAVSSDADNDTIQYTFNWDDGKTDKTDFIASSIETSQTHSWTSAGIYTITVKAFDNKTESGTTRYTILIDVLLIDDKIKGYLIDDDSDETYDSFDNSETGEQTDIEKQDDGTYLIDSDGNGEWDYVYDPETDTLTEYIMESTPDNTLLIISAIIITILVLLILGVMLKRDNDKKKKKKKRRKRKKIKKNKTHTYFF